MKVSDGGGGGEESATREDEARAEAEAAHGICGNENAAARGGECVRSWGELRGDKPRCARGGLCLWLSPEELYVSPVWASAGR